MCMLGKYLNIVASSTQTVYTTVMKARVFYQSWKLFSPQVSPDSSISNDNTFMEGEYAREREYKQLSTDTNGAAVKVETF